MILWRKSKRPSWSESPPIVSTVVSPSVSSNRSAIFVTLSSSKSIPIISGSLSPKRSTTTWLSEPLRVSHVPPSRSMLKHEYKKDTFSAWLDIGGIHAVSFRLRSGGRREWPRGRIRRSSAAYQRKRQRNQGRRDYRPDPAGRGAGYLLGGRGL